MDQRQRRGSRNGRGAAFPESPLVILSRRLKTLILWGLKSGLLGTGAACIGFRLAWHLRRRGLGLLQRDGGRRSRERGGTAHGHRGAPCRSLPALGGTQSAQHLPRIAQTCDFDRVHRAADAGPDSPGIGKHAVPTRIHQRLAGSAHASEAVAPGSRPLGRSRVFLCAGSA